MYSLTQKVRVDCGERRLFTYLLRTYTIPNNGLIFAYHLQSLYELIYFALGKNLTLKMFSIIFFFKDLQVRTDAETRGEE